MPRSSQNSYQSILETLINLLADQEGVKITYIKEKHNEKDF